MQLLRNECENPGDTASFSLLASTLERAISTLRVALGDEHALAERLASLLQRVLSSRLQLAVLGQFKRGKSTFINALLGAPLLPVAVVPLTAVPVFIAWRQVPLVRVHFRDGRRPEELTADEPRAIRDFLFDFVAEEANPENRRSVKRVELFYPAPIVADGTVLIDTPGVGSIFRHNTESAFEVLPECDAAIFVVSADPPITDTELDYLRRIQTKVAGLFYVVNKIDYLETPDRDGVVTFLHDVLVQHGLWRTDAKIFRVSAHNGLAAKQNGKQSDYAASGMADIEAHLIGCLATDKALLLQTALTAKVRETLARCMAELSLRIQALKLPLDQLVSKADAFEQALRSIEERQRTTRGVLAGEWRSLRERVESAIASLRDEAAAYLGRVVDEQLATPFGLRVGSVRDVVADAVARLFDNARDRLVPTFAGQADEVLASYHDRVATDVDAVRRTAAELFDVPFSQLGKPASFAIGLEPYWVTEVINASLIPDPSRWLEHILPSTLRARRARARILRSIDDLVVRNGENLRWALLRGLDETFREASTDLQAYLDEATKETRGVIQEAVARRRDMTFAIDPELRNLDQATLLLAALQHRLDQQ